MPVIAVLALVLGVWPMVARAIRHHPYFAVREVVAPTTGRVSAETLRTAAGIQPGMSIWDLDPSLAEARLRQLPWVRTARVHRRLPNRVVVHVREQRPAAILVVEPAQTLYYVAANGRVFSTVAPQDPLDLPYLTGLVRAEAPAIRRALALLRHVSHTVPELGAISEVHIDKRRGFTLLPVRLPIPIEVGWGGFETKLAELAKVLPKTATLEGEVTSVSLVFTDEVVVRTRPAKPVARKGTT